jgi:hypothetical protein
MAPEREEPVYRPDLRARKKYDKLYEVYRSLTRCDDPVANAMRSLRELS